MLKILTLLILSIPLQAQTVYKTPSGAKYHLDNCRTVKNVSEAITIELALKHGLEPCKVCKPPYNSSYQSSTLKKVSGEALTVPCKGITKAGTRCKHMTSIGNGYCFQHQPK